MSLLALLPNTTTNAETLLLGMALQQASMGYIDLDNLDAEGVAIALFALAERLEDARPGLCAQQGWVKLAELQGVAEAVASATQATAPDGLR